MDSSRRNQGPKNLTDAVNHDTHMGVEVSIDSKNDFSPFLRLCHEILLE
jgi:hypothetical protein